MLRNEMLIQIDPRDTVAVALEPLEKGRRYRLGSYEGFVGEEIPFGHKIALQEIRQGDQVVKYGYPIGTATRTIAAGRHVHTQNVRTNLDSLLSYAYHPEPKSAVRRPGRSERTFPGYPREDGRAGIRNEIWIINTVSCVNHVAERIAREGSRLFAGRTDGIFCFPHPYGCSQMGDDLKTTRAVLADLACHPNAAGALIVGLGCENNNLDFFREALPDPESGRYRFLNTQDVGDDVGCGLKLLGELVERAERCRRQPVPLGKLVVGLKCGGSDGFSGITANPMLGRFTDRLVEAGGCAALTEVPEMFGAEQILMNRSANEAVFGRVVRLINDFKQYFLDHGQVIYENPAPGNKAGGITTLEEKSLGCVQKGGRAEVTGVAGYGERVGRPGLSLVQGPGNDIIAVTALAAAGAQIVLFTTGRGTPLGGPVPTLKIASNSVMAGRKKDWIDFDAGRLLTAPDPSRLDGEFRNLVMRVVSGEQKAKNEQNGDREIAIFKDNVTV